MHCTPGGEWVCGNCEAHIPGERAPTSDPAETNNTDNAQRPANEPTPTNANQRHPTPGPAVKGALVQPAEIHAARAIAQVGAMQPPQALQALQSC